MLWKLLTTVAPATVFWLTASVRGVATAIQSLRSKLLKDAFSFRYIYDNNLLALRFLFLINLAHNLFCKLLTQFLFFFK